MDPFTMAAAAAVAKLVAAAFAAGLIATAFVKFLTWVGVIDSEAMQVKPVAWDGEVGSFLDNAPLAVTGTGGQSLVGQAVREKKPVISNDIQNDPQRMMKKECLERGIIRWPCCR